MSKSKIIITSLMILLLISILFFLGDLSYEYGKKQGRMAFENSLREKLKNQEEIINIVSKFNLKNVEYTKQVLLGVQVTSYNNEAMQTDSTPNITATNRPVREGIIAASPDLLNKGIMKYGDLVFIDCFNQWFVVEDTMNKRFTRRLDVFLFDKQESLKINRTCNIEIIHYNK